METKKICFKDVITFIEKSIDNNCIISPIKFSNTDYYFNIRNRDGKEELISIDIDIDHNYFKIDSPENAGCIKIEYNVTERDHIDLEKVYLDVKEYNEEKVINSFNNFFNEEDSRPTNINSLDDDD